MMFARLPTIAVASSRTCIQPVYRGVEELVGKRHAGITLYVKQQCRRMAAGGESHAPVPQSMKAVLFEGHPKNEGWEWTMAWWYTSSFVIIFLTLTAPDNSISLWAKQEAAARLALKDKGFTDFQFGTHYQNLTAPELTAAWDKLSKNASDFLADDDDDDEEEEEEDEEEGEDDDDDDDDDE